MSDPEGTATASPAATEDPAQDDQKAASPSPALPDDPPALPGASASDDNSTTTDEGDDSDAEGGDQGGADALVKATLQKEEGNGHFKTGNWDEAARCYRRGTNRLKKVSGPGADPQVIALQLTLQTNLSMVLFKQSKYRASRDVASKALEIDPNHVKALYRRAVACRKMGDLEDAKKDLRVALTADVNNVACKKELAAIKKQVETANKEQKSALAKAFSSGGKSSFLYNDKEEEEKKKAQEKKEAEKKKQEAKAKRKQQWEDECVKRMAKGDDAISFDDWEKEREDKEKKEQKEREAKEKEERKKAAAARKAAKASSSNSSKGDDDDDDDELTEQELASLRGYKKTKDGRTTSYFTRELSEDEKQRIGDIAPKKLDSGAATPTLLSTSSSSSPTAVDGSTASRPSAWNQAGTWEEKDCTTWCQDALTTKLQSTIYSGGNGDGAVVAKITKVDELTGEGSVAIAGGKRRYIFDFHAKLKYEIASSSDPEAKTATGMVRLPDICSTHIDDDELEVVFDGSWKKAPSSQHAAAFTAARTDLGNALRSAVKEWVQDFNQQF
uniref:peptidylprolyl isomerase n=1 Tax=Entomoneis paludosa TaxID=265537 RepID=A0A7S2VGP0_9STRA